MHASSSYHICLFCCSLYFSADSSTQDERSAAGTDWLLASEKEKYELGKRWLATMMGEDVEAFTDEKVAVGIGKE